jgi:hypothetical protein
MAVRIRPGWVTLTKMRDFFHSRLGQSDAAGLRHRVVGLPDEADLAGDGRHVDGRLATGLPHDPRRAARRDAKDVHHQALRALDNRLVGILHGSSAAPTTTNTAWAHRTPQAA